MNDTNDRVEIYDLAFNEEYKHVNELITTRRGSPDQAIIGFANKQLELLNGAVEPEKVKEIFKSLSNSDKQRVKELEKWIWQCVEHGACLLWAIQQPNPGFVYKQGNFYNKNLSMLKGPGDIPKGSFKEQKHD